jgi:hypothetical protein
MSKIRLLLHPDDVEEFIKSAKEKQDREIEIVADFSQNGYGLNLHGSGLKLHGEGLNLHGNGQSGDGLASLMSIGLPFLMNAAKKILPILGIGALSGVAQGVGRKVIKGNGQEGGLRFSGPPKTPEEAEERKKIIENWKKMNSIGGNMGRYFIWHADLSDTQKNKIKNAIINKTGLNLNITAKNIRGNDRILVTHNQLKLLENSMNEHKPIQLSFSKSQIKSMKSQSGGLVWLAPLIAAAFGASKLIGKGQTQQKADEMKNEVIDLKKKIQDFIEN